MDLKLCCKINMPFKVLFKVKDLKLNFALSLLSLPGCHSKACEWFLKCTPWTSGISITWTLVRDVYSQAPLQT